ncbi:serine/threonine protein kinase [Aphanothece hegewaldii CCALA 016]|uniref:non-specific serine/threonine protein kinase n=1 Tax=Aphanothece hegewaldii CCALA 016 TaxID=2107694 RepID=A0A2T1LRS1_9CHRO|nr:serine/threonine-protein kinase [Aphanothece hegewaldii]PSF31689.1 serine/threonine protein kinase [Aphanothece hegewaldii CCALA 016]
MHGKILAARYEVLEPLGQGGFSHTYIATDLQNGSRCVVKHLYPASDEPRFIQEATRLFKQEAETLKKLSDNPQIPKIIDYFEEDKQFYLIQELIQGQTLTTQLQPNQPWSETQVIELLKDCLKILEYIHHLGVIHRDVKPDNLMIRQQDKKLVLIDLGSVKEFNPQQSHLISQTIAIGTRGYMPLEQIRGKPRKNSDLYALGIIAIQAITGRHPMDLEEDENDVLIWQPYAKASPFLTEILDKMIQPNPQQRYLSATQVLEALNPTKTDAPIAKIPNRPPLSPPEPKLAVLERATPKNIQTTPQMSSNPNKFSIWLKTPTAHNVGFALGIGIVSTIGVYFLGGQENRAKLAKIEETRLQLTTAFNEHRYEECFTQSQAPEILEIGLPEEQRSEIMVKCGLKSASVLAEQLKFGEAIKKLNEIPLAQIPKDAPYATEITKHADQWAQSLLEQASQIYTKEGNLTEALEMISQIPASSPVQESAESLSIEWTAETRRLEAILKKAELALEYQGLQEAMNYAREISHSTTTDYWLLQAKNIAEKAQGGMKKGETAQTYRRPNPSNNNSSNPPKSEPSSNQGLEVPDDFR